MRSMAGARCCRIRRQCGLRHTLGMPGEVDEGEPRAAGPVERLGRARRGVHHQQPRGDERRCGQQRTPAARPARHQPSRARQPAPADQQGQPHSVAMTPWKGCTASVCPRREKPMGEKPTSAAGRGERGIERRARIRQACSQRHRTSPRARCNGAIRHPRDGRRCAPAAGRAQGARGNSWRRSAPCCRVAERRIGPAAPRIE